MDDLEDILRVWRHLEAHYKKVTLKLLVFQTLMKSNCYLLKHAEIKPMVNQIESNPAKWNHDMIK